MKEKNIQELAIRMGLITVEDMCQYTIAQLVVKIANKVNELVDEVWRFETDVQEILKTQNENIQYLLGEGLHLEVENIFDGWVQDGTFDTLLNHSVLKKVNDRIDETNARLSKKVGGGTLANMSDLGQDIKEALLIPGSGIPIVGEDCVNISNLGSDLKTDYAKNLLKQSMVQINKALYGIDNKDKNCINGTHLWDNVGTSVISYIPVNSKVYDIVFKYNGNLALNSTRMTIIGYDSTGAPTSKLDTSDAGKITIPVGTSYICLQTNSDFDFTNLFIVEHFDGIDYSKIEDVYLKFLMKSDVVKIKSKLYGKKVAVLGDSITGTDYTTPTWWQMIAEETGCSVTNYGVSGTSIAFNEDREQFGKCFAERYTTMSDDFDIVFVMGGTNDRGRTPLGEWRDDNISTMYGALNTLIKGLIDKFPNAIILFATPIQEKVSWNSNYKFDATQSFFNEVQSTTEIPSVQYISEAIKVKCRQYAIPCKNLFDESRITGYNESDWLDTLHPSANGQNKLKVAIQNFWENSV